FFDRFLAQSVGGDRGQRLDQVGEAVAVVRDVLCVVEILGEPFPVDLDGNRESERGVDLRDQRRFIGVLLLCCPTLFCQSHVSMPFLSRLRGNAGRGPLIPDTSGFVSLRRLPRVILAKSYCSTSTATV